MILLFSRCVAWDAALKRGGSDLKEALAAAEAHIRSETGDVHLNHDINIISDSAEINIKSDGIMVQSADAISAIIDDAYTLGRIAALHAMSDLFASHAKPHHALAMLTLPAAMAEMQKDDITQPFQGR